MDASLGEAWPSLAYDIRSAQHSQTNLDDVDSCVALIVDLCFIYISVKVDPRVVLSMFAHICPHLLEQSWTTTFVFCLSGIMSDIIGNQSARRMRGVLVRQLLRIPDEPPGIMDVEALMQDWGGVSYCEAHRSIHRRPHA